MSTIEILIFTIVISVLVYIILNQYFKIQKLESIIDESVTEYENSVNMLNRMISLFVQAKNRLKQVDANGSFSTDDEVGFAFKLIDSVIAEVLSRLEAIKTLIDGEKEKD